MSRAWVRAWEAALAIQPDSRDARYNFALTFKAAGQPQDAVAQLEKLLALHPDDRPKNVLNFREALLGKQEPPERIEMKRQNLDAPSFSRELIAGYVALGLFLVGLVTTLLR